MYVVGRDDIFDRRKGLTVRDFLHIILIVLSGPIGTVCFGLILWDSLKENWPKLMDYHIVKPVKPKPIIPKK